MELIDKNKLLEKLEKLKQNLSASPIVVIENVESLVESLEVKEVADVRFPHEKNIVDKVFGAGNLEYWEYNEAKVLVALAKEELLKDLESKEVDADKISVEYVDFVRETTPEKKDPIYNLEE